ncbi:unnamed protein product [Closterium sp. Yama58-4]|nr:unnamed protein product [Closterium sp. Yama58-4]
MVLVFVISFAVYLYRRPDCLFLGPDEENPGTSDSQRRVVARLNADFAKPGLDPSLIQTLPVIIFRPDNDTRKSNLATTVGAAAAYPQPGGGSSGVAASALLPYDRDTNESILSLRECAVCLGEYAAGERIKVVPACAHGFHADCIDLWLAAKTTCPICRRDLRSPATAPAQESALGPETGVRVEISVGGEGAQSARRARGVAGAEAAAEQQRLEFAAATEATQQADAVIVRIEADPRDDAVMSVPIAAGA